MSATPCTETSGESLIIATKSLASGGRAVWLACARITCYSVRRRFNHRASVASVCPRGTASMPAHRDLGDEGAVTVRERYRRPPHKVAPPQTQRGRDHRDVEVVTMPRLTVRKITRYHVDSAGPLARPISRPRCVQRKPPIQPRESAAHIRPAPAEPGRHFPSS